MSCTVCVANEGTGGFVNERQKSRTGLEIFVWSSNKADKKEGKNLFRCFCVNVFNGKTCGPNKYLPTK